MIISGNSSVTRLTATEPCRTTPMLRKSSWRQDSETGYLFNNAWQFMFCKSHLSTRTLLQCLRDTRIRLIGDSTMRQMFETIQNMFSSQWITDTWSTGLKHRPAMCSNSAVNLTMSLELPPLPFCTHNAPRHYFKSFTAHLNSIAYNENTIIVLNIYSHFLNYHSHVVFEAIREMKLAVKSLLSRNAHAHVVIKGPHAYSFSRSTDHVIWMPDAYAEVYTKFLYEQFKDIHDRVVYLNALDITIATEQWHIHSEDFIIQELLSAMLQCVC